MRIIGGTLRGRRIEYRSMPGVRPTMEKVREAIFNILKHNPKMPNISDSYALDLFAGSGSFGFEAISRGIKHCTFVDKSADCLKFIQKTAVKFSVESAVTTYKADLMQIGPNPFDHQYNVIFAGAPYGKYKLQDLLKSLLANNWIRKEDCVCILEDKEKENIHDPNLKVVKRSRYGKTHITLLAMTDQQ